MAALLSSGDLGAVAGASATVMWQRSAEYYQDRPWRGTWAGGGGGLMMNQAIHTVDLLQWLVGDVVAVSGHSSTRFLGGTIEVEDTTEFVADHAGGARSAFYATLANASNAPVTLEVVTERAVLSLRGDLTIAHADGRVDVIPERRSGSGGRSYWGASHELLINDFYGRLHDAEPFWISPAEAEKSLRIVKEIYRQSYPELSTPSPEACRGVPAASFGVLCGPACFRREYNRLPQDAVKLPLLTCRGFRSKDIFENL